MANAFARTDRPPNRLPAVVISLLLHAGLIGPTLIVWPWRKAPVPIQMTPVTLLTSAELARLTAAQQSETPQEAQTEEPAPTPVAQPVAPTPAPTPTPPPAPAPQPKAAPASKPTPPVAQKGPVPKPTPSPKAPPTKGQAQSFDLDKLAQQLAKDTRATGAVKTNAAKGAARPETDVTTRAAEGLARASTNTSLGVIQAKLIRLWNPNCGVEGAANIIVPIRMSLNIDGSLARAELSNGQDVQDIKDPVMKAAAIRAKTAVSRGAPYDNLPREDYNYWKTVIVNFDAKKACQ